MRPSSRAVAKQLDGLVVVLDTESGQYFQLDAVGSRIWALMVDGVQTDAIARTLTTEFAVEVDVARSDTEAFLADLADLKLVDGPR